jgi:hypothetical protein
VIFWDNPTITVLSHYLHPTLLASLKHSSSPNHPRILHLSIIERLATVIRESEAQGVAVWKSTAILTTFLAELKTEEARATICLFIMLVLKF